MRHQQEHFINKKWQTSSGQAFSVRNPATEEVVWLGHEATDVEIQHAITAARNAFPIWSSLTLEERVSYLKKFQTIIAKEKMNLAKTISINVGKPLWEAQTEIQSMVTKVDISLQAYKERCPSISQELSYGISKRRHKPHGLLVVFGPFNFPAHLPNGHIIPALLAGNTVIWKPSELAPLVAEEIMLCWEKSDLPPGVINMVQGGREVGHLLTSNIQKIDGLLFTGSASTGLFLSEIFAKYPDKILALEMGGNNPLIVTDISDAQAAAYMTIQSAYLTSGQRCSCARRLIVPKGEVGDRFISTLVEMIKQIKVGPYTDEPEPFMGPVINESTALHLLTVQDLLKSRGGKSLIEMHLIKKDTALLNPGLIDVTAALPMRDEEIFGPLLQLVRVADFQAAIQAANNTSFGLTAGLISQNEEEYKTFYQSIKAGIINWNTPLTGASSLAPFGGIGRSGNNRPSGYYAADYTAYPVASIESEKILLPKERMPGIAF